MIIQIRGTGGSGKSTLVRAVMDRYRNRLPVFEEGRRQPIGYVLSNATAEVGQEPTRALYIPGHYETPCGGCDTISTGFDKIFELVRTAHANHYDVLFEGMMLCSDVRRVIDLQNDGIPLSIVDLDVDEDTCIESINIRRRAKNPDAKPVNEKNTRARHRMCIKGRGKLVNAGVTVFHLNREEALPHILGLLAL